MCDIVVLKRQGRSCTRLLATVKQGALLQAHPRCSLSHGAFQRRLASFGITGTVHITASAWPWRTPAVRRRDISDQLPNCRLRVCEMQRHACATDTTGVYCW